MKVQLFVRVLLFCMLVIGGIYSIPSIQEETALLAEEKTQTHPQQPNEKELPTVPRKTLIVYFSHTGNTRILAEDIQKNIGADIFELQPSVPYPQNYDELRSQVAREVESGFSPPLRGPIPDISSYKFIFVGTPVWHYAASPVIISFLYNQELAGKVILPFITHGGFGSGHSADDIKKAAPKATVVEEFSVKGNPEGYSNLELMVWLKKNGFGE